MMRWTENHGVALLFNSRILFHGLQRFQKFLPLNPDLVGSRLTWPSYGCKLRDQYQLAGVRRETTLVAQMLGLTRRTCLRRDGMAARCVDPRPDPAHSTTLGNSGAIWSGAHLFCCLWLFIRWCSRVLSRTFPSDDDAATTGRYDKSVNDANGRPVLDEQGKPKTEPTTVIEQILAVGPAASQIAIKELGTNGGGFFNVNSAHPFENPTPLSNFLEALAILLIPASLCYTFGVMVGDARQGWVILAAMTILLLGFVPLGLWAEQSGNSGGSKCDLQSHDDQAGGNMERDAIWYHRFGLVVCRNDRCF